jgi:hypothetical protein
MTIFNFLKLIYREQNLYLPNKLHNSNIYYSNNNLIGYRYGTDEMCYYGIRLMKINNQVNFKLYIDELKEYSDGTCYPRKSYWFEVWEDYVRKYDETTGNLEIVPIGKVCRVINFYTNDSDEFFKVIFHNEITEEDLVNMLTDSIEMQELMIELI